MFYMENISAPSCGILWKHKQHYGASLLLLWPVQHVPTSFCMWINARTHVFHKHRWSLLLQLRTSSEGSWRSDFTQVSGGMFEVCACSWLCKHEWLHDCMHCYFNYFLCFFKYFMDSHYTADCDINYSYDAVWGGGFYTYRLLNLVLL